MTIFRIIYEVNGYTDMVYGNILLLYTIFGKEDYIIFGIGYDYTEKIKIYFRQIKEIKKVR